MKCPHHVTSGPTRSTWLIDVVLASVTWLRCACRASPSFTPPWKAVTMQGPHLRGGRSALVP